MFGDVLENDKCFDVCKFRDYVVQMNIGPFGDDSKPLELIEAKKSIINEETGKVQACLYNGV